VATQLLAQPFSSGFAGRGLIDTADGVRQSGTRKCKIQIEKP
jgi:hypothetical protein